MHCFDLHMGRRLRELRKQSALSMEAFAHRLGLSLNQYRRYERGESAMKCSMAVDIAAKCGVRIEYFAEGYDQSHVPKRRGGAKSEVRQRIEDLAQTKPIGTSIRFPHGTLPSIPALKRVIGLVGKSGWAEIKFTATGTTVKKVADP